MKHLTIGAAPSVIRPSGVEPEFSFDPTARLGVDTYDLIDVVTVRPVTAKNDTTILEPTVPFQ